MRRLFALIVLGAVFLSSGWNTQAASQRFRFVNIAFEGGITDGEPFREGLAVVCDSSGAFGYIDTKGSMAIPFVFERAKSFSQGLAAAAIPNGKFGFIGKDGKFTISPVFDEAGQFSDGLCLVSKKGREFYIDQTGQEVALIRQADITPATDFSSGRAWVHNKGETAAILSIDGTRITNFDFVWYQEFSGGVAWASKDMGSDFYHINMGLVDQTGNWVIEPGIYTDARPFQNGVSWAVEASSRRKVLIDKSGRILLRYGKEHVTDFDSGVCVTDANGGIVLINQSDELLWSSKSYSLCFRNAYGEGRALVRRKSDGVCYIVEDTAYQEPVKEPAATVSWTYMPPAEENKELEICLKVGSPIAIVNNNWCFIDPEDHRIAPIVVEGRTLLPLRFVTQNLSGWKVIWDVDQWNTVVLQGKDQIITLRINKNQAEILDYDENKRWYQNSQVPLSSVPSMIDGRTFLPLRGISELTGYQVHWYDNGLILLTGNATPPTEQRVRELLIRYEQ